MNINELAAAAATRDLTQDEINDLAQQWRDVTARRLDLDRQSKKLKDEETVAQTTLIAQMRLRKLTASAAGVVVTVNQAPEYVPHVMDWDAYWAFIHNTNNFSLLEKRPGKVACQEMWDNGLTIPGVEKYPVYKLSVTKLKGA